MDIQDLKNIPTPVFNNKISQETKDKLDKLLVKAMFQGCHLIDTLEEIDSLGVIKRQNRNTLTKCIKFLEDYTKDGMRSFFPNKKNKPSSLTDLQHLEWQKQEKERLRTRNVSNAIHESYERLQELVFKSIQDVKEIGSHDAIPIMQIIDHYKNNKHKYKDTFVEDVAGVYDVSEAHDVYDKICLQVMKLSEKVAENMLLGMTNNKKKQTL